MTLRQSRACRVDNISNGQRAEDQVPETMKVAKMRVVFLDFDGVLHPLVEAGSPVIHFIWLPLLLDILEGHEDVHIVVQSTWQYIHTDHELREFLGPRFFAATGKGPRQESIERYLHANHHLITSHIILDDAQDEFSPIPWNFVVCDSALGVSEPAVQAKLKKWVATTR